MSDEGKQIFKAALIAIPIGLLGGAFVYYSMAPAMRAGLGAITIRMIWAQMVLLSAAGFVVPVLSEKIGGFAGQALWLPLLAGAGALLMTAFALADSGGVALGVVPLGLTTGAFIFGGVCGMAWVNAG